MTHTPHEQGSENPEVAHEDRDVDIGRLYGFLVGLAVGGVLVGLAMWGVLRAFSSYEERRDPARAAMAPRPGELVTPEPRLQTQPAADLAGMRAEEQRLLTTYGVSATRPNAARIPIERAMEAIAAGHVVAPVVPLAAGAAGATSASSVPAVTPATATTEQVP